MFPHLIKNMFCVSLDGDKTWGKERDEWCENEATNG